ncbi:MAG: hypothetical protein LBU18_01530 [Treponema sp.]|jgi:hypothetical protein|nr:hypothetical protein [Treponema sp.]
MKNRPFFQIFGIGFAVFAGFLILSCTMDIPNEVRPAEEIFAKLGGILIFNMAEVPQGADAEGLNLKFLGIKDGSGRSVNYRSTGNLINNEIIKPQDAAAIILDEPGEYTIELEYAGGYDSKEGQHNPQVISKSITRTVEHRKYTFLWISNAELLIGKLNIINLSRRPITSAKITPLGDNSTSTVKELGIIYPEQSYASQLDPGEYYIEIYLALSGNGQDATEERYSQKVNIVAGTVTNILVFANTSVAVSDNSNLWVVNQCAVLFIAKLEIRESNDSSYADLMADQLPLYPGDYIRERIAPGKYDIKVTLYGGEERELKSVPLSGDPVFIYVQDDNPKIGYIVPGDVDEDGFPDWWEDQYFGLDAVNDKSKPARDGDEDKDKLTNWEEYLNGTNPQDRDTDDDRLTDWEEVMGRKDPDIAEHAELPDTFEAYMSNPPLNPLKPDTDEDGYTDYIELISRSDPTDGLKIPGGSITITVPWGTASK